MLAPRSVGIPQHGKQAHPAIGTNERNAQAVLARVAQRERVRSCVEQLTATAPVAVRLVAEHGQVMFATGSASPPSAPTIVLPVTYMQQPLARVEVQGDGEQVPSIAHMLAYWLEDVLALEHEIGSLTHAVVHSYEELHVLYELGGVLGGVLDVAHAGQLIVQALVASLGAAHVTLTLLQHGVEQLVAQATSPEITTPTGPHARAIAPLLINQELIGMLVVQGKFGAEDFSSDDLKLLTGVAALAAPAVRNAQLYEVARLQADTDALTGVFNHRRIQERIDEELERARRYEHPLTIIMVDLDNFKLFNDVYGHLIGDRVLQTIAECLRANVRTTDYVGRYGGDEFMLVLPETDGNGALELANRLLNDVAARDITVNGTRLPLSISLGIASFPNNSTTKHELLAHADTALYESKHSGGRTVRVAHAPRKDWLHLQSNNFGVLEGLVHTVDAKDHYTHAHSEIVTEAALLLARQLNLSEETQRALRIAGLLHDVGKIGIPDEVLKKPGKLTIQEYEVMKQHVQLSEMIIKGVPHLGDVLDAVAHHHERYDGSGYPYGKAQENIPLLGRIMSIADAYSAMSVDRPYRKGRQWFDIRTELENGAGTQFDPELVKFFIRAVEETHNAREQTP